MYHIDTPKRSQLIKSLTNIGIPREVMFPLISVIERWTLGSGPEWTVKRLKHLKTEYLAHISGTRKPEYPWISHKGNLPAGPFKFIFKMKGKDTKKALSALMVYTGFKVNKTVWLDSQFDKAYEAITSKVPLWAKPAIDGYTELLDKKLSQWRFNTLPLRYTVPKIAEAIRDRSYGGSLWDPVRTGNGLARGLKRVDNTDLSWIPKRYRQEWPNKLPPFQAGRIGLIQEKGLKARVVAMPGLLIQSILKPLNGFLLNICRSAPWDYTHDQSAGVIPAQEALGQGKTVHCVDLSSATDRFPYQWQSTVLSYIT